MQNRINLSETDNKVYYFQSLLYTTIDNNQHSNLVNKYYRLSAMINL